MGIGLGTLVKRALFGLRAVGIRAVGSSGGRLMVALFRRELLCFMVLSCVRHSMALAASVGSMKLGFLGV